MMRGDKPDAFFEVDFLPLGQPQLLGTQKDIGKDAQGVADGKIAVVGVDCAKQMPHFGSPSKKGARKK
jgi:hypothetical protein